MVPISCAPLLGEGSGQTVGGVFYSWGTVHNTAARRNQPNICSSGDKCNSEDLEMARGWKVAQGAESCMGAPVTLCATWAILTPAFMCLIYLMCARPNANHVVLMLLTACGTQFWFLELLSLLCFCHQLPRHTCNQARKLNDLPTFEMQASDPSNVAPYDPYLQLDAAHLAQAV